MLRKKIIPLICVLLCVTACGIYSFSGTSIQGDVKSITINYFDYKALKVNPTLSNDLTEALRNQFRKMTNLEQVDMDGDLEIIGEITHSGAGEPRIYAHHSRKFFEIQ